MAEIQQEVRETHLPPDLFTLFNHHSAVMVIDGKRGDGKTDFALKMGEDALKDGVISSMASNIRTDDKRVKHITNLPDLQFYLMSRGRKYYVLDEAGQAVPSQRWMSSLNVKILGIIQLIRHYHGRLCFIAPSKDFIDKNLKKTEVCDAFITKKTLRIAEVKNYVTRKKYNLYDIDRTEIPFSQKPTFFTLEKPIKLADLSEWEADMYQWSVENKSINTIAKESNRYKMQVLRSLKKFGKHYFRIKESNV